MSISSSVEWLEIELSDLESTKTERSLSLNLDLINESYRTAKVRESILAQRFAEFSINCHANKIPLITFNAWLKL